MSSGALDTTDDLALDIQQISFSAEQIAERVQQMGEAISHDYAGQELLLVGVLKGVLVFMADLLRAISIPVAFDLIAIESYSPETRHRGMVQIIKDLDISVTGRPVLFIEDVVDTGLTLNYLLRQIRAREPDSLEVCALFDKHKRRLIDLPIKYTGFDLPDRFVVGYGLDYQEYYRNLPYVGLLKPEVFQEANYWGKRRRGPK
jgi:hypoxanthine phosphoribosyltransferase